MIQSWPVYDEALNFAAEETAFEKVMDLVKAVRAIRNDMGVHPAKKTSMILETADAAPFRAGESYLAKFAFASEVSFTEKYEGRDVRHGAGRHARCPRVHSDDGTDRPRQGARSASAAKRRSAKRRSPPPPRSWRTRAL